ncbi:MAG: phosphatase PAP2 family protein [Marmoricola sp.]
MKQRPWMMTVVIAVLMAATCVLTSILIDRPIHDTEGFLGSAWIRLPLLIIGAFAADVIPRSIWRGRSELRSYPDHARDVIAEHWDRKRTLLVVVGITTFYVTYISYRNLKGFLPFVESENGRPKLYDRSLDRIDHWIFFGHAPATVLHDVLGTSFSAHFLSATYLIFLPMVPISIAIWAVWGPRVRDGYWFITAQCICWLLGTASYYALPTLGPALYGQFLPRFRDLPQTGVSRLQATILDDRAAIYAFRADGVQSVAGFASLHVAITMMLALVGHYTLRPRWLRITLWAYAGITLVSTTYFGWHYISDDIAGAAIAIIAVYVAGIGTGQTFDRTRITGAQKAEDSAEAAGISE